MKKSIPRTLAVVFMLAVFSGCLGRSHHDADQGYDYSSVVRPTEMFLADQMHNDGSLFDPPSGSWSPWTDVTAQAVGDIVTVRISVSSLAEGSASTDLSRDSNVEASIKAMMGFEDKIPGNAPGVDGTSPEHLFKSNYTSNFKGDGDTKRSGKIVADVSALVTRVYPNGNMMIHGSQNMLINNENSLLTVDGIIRPTDVSADNIVISNRIANARIQVTGRGVVSDKQRPGILMRVLDWAWWF